MIRAIALVLALQVISAFAAPNLKDDTYTGKDCDKFVVDQCERPKGKDNFAFETVNTETADDCQFYCDTIYNNKATDPKVQKCKFFVFDRRQNLCELWKITKEEYEGTCHKKGGPKNAADVKTACAKDACYKFKNEYCILEGGILEHFSEIPNEETCQKACDHLPTCKFYMYDASTQDCELRDSDKFNCDMVRGTPDATGYDKCDPNVDPTTTTEKATTTKKKP